MSLNRGIGGSVLRSVLGFAGLPFDVGAGMGTCWGPGACVATKPDVARVRTTIQIRTSRRLRGYPNMSSILTPQISSWEQITPEDLQTLEEERPAGTSTARRDALQVRLFRKLEDELQCILYLPEAIFAYGLRPAKVRARIWSRRQNLSCIRQDLIALRIRRNRRAASVTEYWVIEADGLIVYYVLCGVYRVVE